jgi:hypothetical protein
MRLHRVRNLLEVNAGRSQQLDVNSVDATRRADFPGVAPKEGCERE